MQRCFLFSEQKSWVVEIGAERGPHLRDLQRWLGSGELLWEQMGQEKGQLANSGRDHQQLVMLERSSRPFRPGSAVLGDGFQGKGRAFPNVVSKLKY